MHTSVCSNISFQPSHHPKAEDGGHSAEYRAVLQLLKEQLGEAGPSSQGRHLSAHVSKI